MILGHPVIHAKLSEWIIRVSYWGDLSK